MTRKDTHITADLYRVAPKRIIPPLPETKLNKTVRVGKILYRRVRPKIRQHQFWVQGAGDARGRRLRGRILVIRGFRFRFLFGRQASCCTLFLLPALTTSPELPEPA
jgi:hypothetical protein